MIGGPRRAGGWVGWLAVGALLLHGWLPIVLQVQLSAPEAAGHAHHGSAARHTHDGSAAEHAQHGSAAGASPPPSGERPECPLLGGAICLCAAFAKLLQAPAVAGALVPVPVRRARGRFAAGRPRRQGRAAPFDPRAPPPAD